jgi:hypothetical protein
MHLKTLQIKNTFVLGSTWNLNRSITEGLWWSNRQTWHQHSMWNKWKRSELLKKIWSRIFITVDYLEYLGINWIIILKRKLQKYYKTVLIGFVRLSSVTSSRHLWLWTEVGTFVKHLSQMQLVKKDSAPRSSLDSSYTGTNRRWVDSHSHIETSVIERHCRRLPVMGEVDLSACCHGDVTWGSLQLGLRDGNLFATKKLLWIVVIRHTHTHREDDIGCKKLYWTFTAGRSDSAMETGRKGDRQDRRKSDIGTTEWRRKDRNTESKGTRRKEEQKIEERQGRNNWSQKQR